MFQMIVIVFVVSLIVGLIGRNRKFGFWGYFFASLLLSPIIGLLLVVASAPKEKQLKASMVTNCDD
jgi:hypothetical protein